ncbi:hypothetical protein [Sedimentibacter sp. B4]|uniref:hypothetical protein n=1 Tax=Sedimentibacter sp. B4 TaxID=304766 RepID=UPI0002ECC607|nr:hypothetical protein [Sedimentibacter sp. B4]
MILKDIKLTIDEIMLDPSNPRFSVSLSSQQEIIQGKLMEDHETKNLLNSMLTGITWVNKIVVRKLTSYAYSDRSNLGNIEKYKYAVVEGNTRLACLKDEKMDNKFNRSIPIPVIEVVKEENETQDDFEREIRRLQGIANVMVVKDWGLLPKAKHIYRLYEDKRQLEPTKSNQQIFKDIGMEIGIKFGEVKSFVYRYIFYKEIIENASNIEKEDWKFLEVFEQNEAIRKTFGWDNSKSTFEWYEDVDEDDTLLKQELLYMYPDIIKSAKREQVSSKKVRDIIREIHDKRSIEELIFEFKDVVNDGDDNSYSNWKTKFLNKQIQQDNESEWNNKLNDVVDLLKQYPINEDWPLKHKDKLLEIKKKASQLIKYLDTMEAV